MFTAPSGSVSVVIAMGSMIVIENVLRAVSAGFSESAATTPNVKVPARVGTPLTTPLEVSSVSPGGSPLDKG